MKICWLDPINTDAQFMNILAEALASSGHQVCVHSIKTKIGGPAGSVEWVNFDRFMGARLTERERKTMLLYSMVYPVDWLNAVIRLKRMGVKAILLSTSMRLPEFDTFGHLLLRAAGIRTAVIVHKPHPAFYEKNGRDEAIRYRGFFRFASKILVMTEYTRRQLMDYYDLPYEKFALYPHPHLRDYLQGYKTDEGLLARMREWAGDRPVVAIHSGYLPEHGHEVFLDSLPHIRRMIPAAKILFVTGNVRSSDPFASRAEGALKAAGFATGEYHLHFAQYSNSELRAFLEVSSVIVLPYNWATQSGVIPLASGFGIPVVTTDVGGLREMVEEGVSGEIVPPGDPIALARACARVLDPLKYDRYREGARRHADGKLSPSLAASSIAEVLAELEG